jgi:diaminohydroxyphosphoribosylaminopyrimidine deaminase/5-amino-6-(5-phosphoribosylamino)uracil reductase
VPVLVAVAADADVERCAQLAAAGCEVLHCPGTDASARLTHLLQTLGQRRCTNLLVEGGGQLLGGLFDLDCIDEVHAFVAPKLVGGREAASPLAGSGLAAIPEIARWHQSHVEVLDDDVYIHGRVRDTASAREF